MCFDIMAGCAGIPVAKKDIKDVMQYCVVKVLFQPNMCGPGDDPAFGSFLEKMRKSGRMMTDPIFEAE
jgi:hypothetical protein